ncbi:hypothetical protein [uncultured Pseudacidovorax sp.]|uniref:hypothetical protein n=1 Tax=uncultured Pseudacidovorax sp. TaxID=679313 RepID=UPI0025D15A34|nr:hypothetical protein [uncultured Pseudacidovorax sp.]
MSAVLTFVRLVRMRRSAGASLPRSVAWAAGLLAHNRASVQCQRAQQQPAKQPGDAA